MSELVASAPELLDSGLRRRRRVPVSIVLALVVIALVVACALFGDAIAPQDPDAQDLSTGVSGIGSGHPLGTDELGRDVLSRLIAGAHSALVGPLVISVGAMLIGSLCGVVAGYRGGAVDSAIMRVCDLMYALPALLVAIVVVGVRGGGYWTAVLVLLVLSTPYDTRLIRGATLDQRSRPYVEAARAIGLPARTIMFRHIWPNLLALIVANTFLTFALSIVSLSALSFLGLGVEPGLADWGQMISDSRDQLFTYPVVPIAPCIALVLTAAAMNLIGDWLYELLQDRGRAR
jgi:peptide/nickel transport system permease protein